MTTRLGRPTQMERDNWGVRLSPGIVAVATAIAGWLEKHVWVLLFPLAVPAIWPFVAYGLPRSADGAKHLLRLGLLDTYIRHGIYFPRWMPDVLLGFGYPRFGYYSPAAYYLVEALHLLGLDLYRAFILSLMGSLLLAGLGMYRLASDVLGARSQMPALIAAVGYLYAPYLLIDAHMRGAFAELLALALLPWVLWSARRLMRSGQPGRYLAPFALLLSCLALSHPLVLLLAPPVVAGYLLLNWWLGRRTLRLGAWALSGLAFAMGITAFYWMPALGERDYLGTVGEEIARYAWLPLTAWHPGNFLDTGLTYDYLDVWPIIRLGLVQLGLAVAGVVLARRRDPEWLFFIFVALITGSMIGAWALPIWLSSDLLVSVQFSWRMLTILSLALALLPGGILLPFGQTTWRTLATGTVIALIVFTQSPRLAAMGYYDARSVDLSPAVMAHWEMDNDVLVGAQGDTALQEFRPRWADRTLEYSGAPVAAAPGLEAIATQSNALDLELRVTSAGGPMRFTTFYYPGWQVFADGAPLATYPSTNLGLLTVDLPAGAHVVRVIWTGTPLQQVSSAVSMVSLAMLAAVTWFVSRRRLQALVPLTVLGIVLILLGPRPLEAVSTPAGEFDKGAVALIGYRVEQAKDRLYLYPYWLVKERPSDAWRTHWELRDGAGQVVAESSPEIWYNTTPASNWPPGTVADDAQRLALPAGLPAGDYALTLSAGEDMPATTVGTVVLEATPAHPRLPEHRVAARFGEDFFLEGYDLSGAAASNPNAAYSAVAGAGDTLTYTLFWRAGDTPSQSPHSFVHLVDSSGRPVSQEDHLPGPTFRPPRLWDRIVLQPDYYRLRLPDDTPGGLYWPAVGMYDRALERLPAHESDGVSRDEYRLPPIKIVGRAGRPEVRIRAKFSDFAELLGYDLELPEAGLRPGDAFRVTLHSRASKAPVRDYTRFVHLYNPDRAMAAQYDSPPQDGVNPTSSWLRGEQISDTVTLQVRPDAPPGEYTLYVGYYDPASGNERLPAWLGNGDAAPDASVPIATIRVTG